MVNSRDIEQDKDALVSAGPLFVHHVDNADTQAVDHLGVGAVVRVVCHDRAFAL
jgi:hypothetical protein